MHETVYNNNTLSYSGYIDLSTYIYVVTLITLVGNRTWHQVWIQTKWFIRFISYFRFPRRRWKYPTKPNMQKIPKRTRNDVYDDQIWSCLRSVILKEIIKMIFKVLNSVGVRKASSFVHISRFRGSSSWSFACVTVCALL